jgi:hypothetical protein
LIVVLLQFDAPIYILLVFSSNIVMDFNIFLKEEALKVKIINLTSTQKYNIYGNAKYFKILENLKMINTTKFDEIFDILISSTHVEL